MRIGAVLACVALLSFAASAVTGDISVPQEGFEGKSVIYGTMKTYWNVPDADVSEILSYDATGLASYKGYTSTTNPNPAIVSDWIGSKYLKVEAEGETVYRTLDADGRLNDNYIRPTDDVVVDSLMMFSPADSLMAPKLDDGSKFAMWLYAGEDGVTNLYVTAGGGGVADSLCYEATNYCLGPGVDADTWYRVTVRVLKNITFDELRPYMGFVVFIDGRPMACIDDDYAAKLPAFGRSTPLAAYLIQEKRLFPSIVSASATRSDRAAGISGVGFRGTGMVDDISIAKAGAITLDFSNMTNAFRFSWSDGVTGFKYRINGANEVHVDAASLAYLAIEGADTSAEVSVSDVEYDTDNGWKGVGLPVAVMFGEGDLYIGATRANYEIVGSAESYETLSNAIAHVDAAGGMVRLLRSVSETLSAQIPVDREVVLDLAGNTLSLDGTVPVFNIDVSPITVISSGSAGLLRFSGDAPIFSFTANASAGIVTIGSSADDNGVAVSGRLASSMFDRISIYSGWFTDDSAKNSVAAGSRCSDEPNIDGYYTVAPYDAVAAGTLGVYASEDEAKSAAEAAESVIAAGKLEWPASFPEANKTAARQAKYSALFKVTRTGTVVSVVLKEVGTEIDGVKTSLSDAVKAIRIGEASAGQDSTVNVSAVPGLYYGISSGDSLDAMTVDEWKLATEESVDLDVPAKKSGQTQGFYKVEASASAEE